MASIEEKIVFGVSPNEDGQRVTLMVGIPRGAWEYMKDGKTNTLDLTKIGLPVQLILYGGDDHDTCIAAIEKHNASLGLSTLDQRREDFSIKPRSKV